MTRSAALIKRLIAEIQRQLSLPHKMLVLSILQAEEGVIKSAKLKQLDAFDSSIHPIFHWLEQSLKLTSNLRYRKPPCAG